MKIRLFEILVIAFLTPIVSPPAFSTNLSLKEKIAQLLIISSDASTISKTTGPISKCLGGVQIQWGYYSLNKTRQITTTLQKLAENSSCKIPLFVAVDYEGGSVYAPDTLGLMNLLTNMMLGAARDEKETAALFFLAGKELKRAGINMTFGPVLDVNTNRLNPIIGIRSISDNPQLVWKIGEAISNGFRASDIITTVKHFPGHGATSWDSHKTLPVVSISKENLFKNHIFPFRKAIETGAPAVMTAHVLYKSLDRRKCATLSKKIISGILKNELSFKGVVITDSLDMKAITMKYRPEEAVLKALTAGADILLIGKGDFAKTVLTIEKEALKNPEVRNRVENAFRKILALKKKSKLRFTSPQTSDFDMAYVDIARKLAEKAITMVKNDGIIPLGKNREIMIVLFSPQRFDSSTLLLYKDIIRNGYKVRQYKFGISPSASDIDKIVRYAGKSDILIVGSFQWSSTQNKKQIKAIKKILQLGKPSIMLSLMSPYDILNYEKFKAVIALYGITDFSMEAVAKVLTGRVAAEGKLPVLLK